VAKPLSERAAWEFVLAHARTIAREGLTALRRDRSSDLARISRDHAEMIVGAAEGMIAQLGRGIHANPPLVIYGNPPRGAELMSRRVYAIEYKHTGDGQDYRHDCAAGVSMFAQGDGTIILQRPDGRPLSKELEV